MSKLCLIPSVGYWIENDKKFFDRKFYDGLSIYQKLWGGALQVCIRKSTAPLPKFGLVEYVKEASPIKFVFLDDDEKPDIKHLNGVDVALVSADEFRNLGLSKICHLYKVKCIYYIEYILETRIQINFLSSASFFKKIKTTIWLLLMELKRRSALSYADGLQANGTPAFTAYQNKTKDGGSALLYFDSRNTVDMLISNENLNERLSRLLSNNTLRLAFSGRITAMKGADDLLEFAKILARKNVNFHLDIFGDGDLNAFLISEIDKAKLSNFVTFHGAVDYKSELVPFIQQNIDVFICCHKQSDPSCTYLETYSCGVPILGYANKAHSGILKIADVGWEVPLRSINTLVGKLIEINSNRNEVAEKSRRAIEFAKSHTFEKTFQNRIDNCRYVMEQHD
ncbi:glycosyltransferase [Methylophaga sp.]|jgi:glycosyltransferase involved in cell wall biosynthesis|uniref:glycosyltransferase n=1 Tax=Methylophaga sp. TaxID=2024840 RepID=UPI0025E9EAE3|nr:glycosyltransferase [Methylophaga sp.]